MIIIGGAPSSGSSLFARMLNRHSKLFCGKETSLFTKKALYENWTDERLKIISENKLNSASHSWLGYTGIDWHLEEGLITREEIQAFSRESVSFMEFINKYYSKVLQVEKKVLWSDKTPDNVFLFDRLNALSGEFKFIQIVRDPYDTIASLIFRGYSVYEATARYLCNTLVGLNSLADTHFVQYEKLVQSPIEILQTACAFMNIAFQTSMLHVESEGVSMTGWKHDESGKISTSSIGRFSELSKKDRQKVLYYLDHLEINPNSELFDVAKWNHLDCIIERMGYTKRPVDKGMQYAIRRDFYLHKAKCVIKQNHLVTLGYPLRIRN